MKKEELQKDIEKMFQEYRENPSNNYSDKDRFFRDYCEAIITQQNKELLAEVRGIVGKDEYVGLPVTQAQEQSNYDKKQRNQFRSELRTKLDELEKNT